MQPLINLKQFIAVLLLLVIPAALLVAYFRKYDSEAGGHHHGEPMTHGKTEIPQNAEMKMVPVQSQTHLEAAREQFEASRMQFEASRSQLEASRTALEALTPEREVQKQTAPQPADTGPTEQNPPSSDGHEHKH